MNAEAKAREVLIYSKIKARPIPSTNPPITAPVKLSKPPITAPTNPRTNKRSKELGVNPFCGVIKTPLKKDR